MSDYYKLEKNTEGIKEAIKIIKDLIKEQKRAIEDSSELTRPLLAFGYWLLVGQEANYFM